MRVDANGGSGPNYWPNRFGGPVQDPGFLEPPFEVSGLAAHTPYRYPNDDFVQPGNLYRDVMTDQDRANLIGNIVSIFQLPRNVYNSGRQPYSSKLIQTMESRVAKGLGLDINEVERLANMATEERARATEK